MKFRVFALGLVAVLCVVPLFAQDIPPGDDKWDSLGAGATNVVLSSADWNALCGVDVPDTAVQLKGFNIPGQGTADTIVTRLQNAALPSVGSTATVDIVLKDLSLVSDGSTPCSSQGITLRVSEADSQDTGKMTITKTSSAGGTFIATVKVNAIVEAIDSSGNPTGRSTYLSGSLDDTSASPWSYAPPTAAPGAAPPPWHPGVNPATRKPVKVCRRGNKILPAWHCYQPPPKCKVIVRPVGSAIAEPTPVEPCFIDAQPTDTSVR